MNPMAPKKACWSCRTRKIRCDLKIPTCKQCSKANKECQYGVRLSWPKEHDGRRSLVSTQTQPWMVRVRSEHHWLNVGYQDIDFHLMLSSDAFMSNLEVKQLCWKPQSIPKLVSWVPPGQSGLEHILISYYENVLSVMLTSVDDGRFRGLLIAMSFLDSSASSTSVLQSLYALAALHLYGHKAAIPFKVKAFKSLAMSAQSSLSSMERMQHIAAQLLLSLYEIFDSSNPRNQWTIHTCYAKKMGKQLFCLEQTYDGEAAIMLDWLLYHDVLAKFSTRYWIQRTSDQEECAQDDQIRRRALLLPRRSKIMSTAGCSAEILETISNVCDNVLDSSDSKFNSVEHVEALDRLERRLKYATQYTEEGNDPQKIRQNESAVRLAELYRLVGLIYLYRGAQRLPSSASKVTSVVDAGYETAAQLVICDRAFPIFILGCEARCDEERLLILNLIRRTQESGSGGSIVRARQFIEAAWTQDDLDTESKLDYTKKFEAVMSMSSELPSFA